MPGCVVSSLRLAEPDFDLVLRLTCRFDFGEPAAEPNKETHQGNSLSASSSALSRHCSTSIRVLSMRVQPPCATQRYTQELHRLCSCADYTPPLVSKVETLRVRGWMMPCVASSQRDAQA